MSMLFMLFALVGCLLVLGGGSYALRRVVARLGPGADAAAEGLESAEVPSQGRAEVGGYVPAPWSDGEAGEPDDLSSPVRSRAANLVALGRTEEAVRLLREREGADEERARLIVGALERSDGPGPALEP